MPSPTPDLARTARALEALPLGPPGNAVATCTASLLRVISSLRQQQEAIAGLRERLRALEKERAAARGRNEIVIPPRGAGK